MIDIHTHILPGIDDGASGVEEAVEMTALLHEQKIHAAVCTPHFDPGNMTLEDFISRRTYAMSLMGAARIILIPASETQYHEYLFHYPDLSGLCMGNSRYLLLELPFQRKWEKPLFQGIEKLMNYYDCIPVIAHIERYPAANRRNIKHLLEMGCLLQLNASALLNRGQEKMALRMIREDRIALLGSDCHNRSVRPPLLLPAYEIVKEKLGIEYRKKLEFNSEAVIKNVDIRNIDGYQAYRLNL